MRLIPALTFLVALAAPGIAPADEAPADAAADAPATPSEPTEAPAAAPVDPDAASVKEFWAAHVARLAAFDATAFDDFDPAGSVRLWTALPDGGVRDKEVPLNIASEYGILEAYLEGAAMNDDRWEHRDVVVAQSEDGWTVTADLYGVASCVSGERAYTANVRRAADRWLLMSEVLPSSTHIVCAPDPARAEQIVASSVAGYEPVVIEKGLKSRLEGEGGHLIWIYEARSLGKKDQDDPMVGPMFTAMGCAEFLTKQVLHHGGRVTTRVTGKKGLVIWEAALTGESCN